MTTKPTFALEGCTRTGLHLWLASGPWHAVFDTANGPCRLAEHSSNEMTSRYRLVIRIWIGTERRFLRAVFEKTVYGPPDLISRIRRSTSVVNGICQHNTVHLLTSNHQRVHLAVAPSGWRKATVSLVALDHQP